MAWPEDPHTAGELPGQLRLEAYQILSHRKVNEDEEGNSYLAARFAAILSNAAAEGVMEHAKAELVGEPLGGVEMFDAGKVTRVMKAAAEEAYEDWDDRIPDSSDAERRFDIDIFTSRGKRSTMEDRHTAITDLNAYLGFEEGQYPPQSWFGVYDGHGGVEAAKYCQAQLHCQVTNQAEFKDDPKLAMTKGFLETDRMFLEKSERDALTCGATAVTVLIRGRKLYIAWLGDSQAAMCKGGEMVKLMDPHKPEREDEKARIEAAEGVVVWYGAWRVNGVLSVSRAIGDRKLKKWVIGQPDVAEFDITDDAEYMILGCDGLWDVMDNEKVLTFVKDWTSSHPSICGLAKSLVEHCIDNLASTDNISIVLVFFHNMTSDAWSNAS